LQLAIYRVAWAELVGCEIDDVEAAFFDVLTGSLIRTRALPDRVDLERRFIPLVTDDLPPTPTVA